MKTVLITGAGSGLGKATAELFLNKGFRVVAADIAFITASDERPSREMISLPLDVASGESVNELVDGLRAMNISIDILINNAGIFDLYPLSEEDPEKTTRMIQVNAIGPLRLVRAFLPDLIRNGGRVIQISSESIKFPGAFQPYQISKIALEAYSRSVRQELLLRGVHLVIIRPGAIRTNLSSDLNKYANPVSGSVYDHEFRRFVQMTTKFIGRVVPAGRVARLVYKAAVTARPRYIYKINNNPVITVISGISSRLTDRSVIKLLKTKTSNNPKHQ